MSGARFQLESADRIEQADVAGAAGNTHQTLGAGDESRDRTGAKNSTLRAERYHSDLSGASESNVGNHDVSSRAVEESNSGTVLTGWEAERGIWLEAERTRRVQAQAQIESSQVDSGVTVGKMTSLPRIPSTLGSTLTARHSQRNESARKLTEYIWADAQSITQKGEMKNEQRRIHKKYEQDT